MIKTPSALKPPLRGGNTMMALGFARHFDFCIPSSFAAFRYTLLHCLIHPAGSGPSVKPSCSPPLPRGCLANTLIRPPQRQRRANPSPSSFLSPMLFVPSCRGDHYVYGPSTGSVPAPFPAKRSWRFAVTARQSWQHRYRRHRSPLQQAQCRHCDSHQQRQQAWWFVLKYRVKRHKRVNT